MIGDRSRSGAAFPGSTGGVNLRRGTAAVLMNSITTNFKTQGLKIDDDVTWKYHCRALGAMSGAGPLFTPSVYCSPLVGVEPVAAGSVLLLGGAPNPFRRDVDVSFSLARGGSVRVEVFSPDGRLVATLADRVMDAGKHTLTWRTGAGTPSGVYMYRVLA